MKHTRIPQTEVALAAMAARNEARVEIVKRVMGVNYACHPANRVQRRDARPAMPFHVIVTDALHPGLAILRAGPRPEDCAVMSFRYR
jgi:hypothetical protein